MLWYILIHVIGHFAPSIADDRIINVESTISLYQCERRVFLIEDSVLRDPIYDRECKFVVLLSRSNLNVKDQMTIGSWHRGYLIPYHLFCCFRLMGQKLLGIVYVFRLIIARHFHSVVTFSDYFEELLLYLNTAVQHLETPNKPYIGTETCTILDILLYYGPLGKPGATINEDIGLTIDSLSDEVDSEQVYIYSHSDDNTTVYRITRHNTIAVAGCMIIQDDIKDEPRWSFNYTDIKTVQAWISVYDANGICREYVNFLQNNQKVYSPFHGSPVIFVPSFPPSIHPDQPSTGFLFSYAREGLQILLGLLDSVKGLIEDTIFGTQRSRTDDHWKLTINETGYASSFDNLHIQEAYWGHPKSVPAIDNLTSVMSSWGYRPGISLAAAPYDFRLTPYENEEFFDRLAVLIKTIFSLNNKKRVILLGHGMGGLYIQNFLSRYPQKWKDIYVKYFVSIGAPWGGISLAAKFLLRERPQTSYSQRQQIQLGQTWLSTLYLLPNVNAFDPNHTIISTPSKNYSVSDYETLLYDLGLNKSAYAYRRIKYLVSKLEPPHIETYCVYGDGIDTDNSYSYITDNTFPHGNNFLQFQAPGDGVVASESASACKMWHRRQIDPVHVKSFQNLKHYDLLNEPQIFAYIKDLVFA